MTYGFIIPYQDLGNKKRFMVYKFKEEEIMLVAL